MNKKDIAQIKSTILEYNRKPTLSPAFDKLLDGYIKSGKYMSVERLQRLRNDIVQNLVEYANKDKIRKGNIRARLRMITLYNLAGASQGFVASTDNFSELAAGFWTLHGDVGDVSPIQSLTKSWEVPALAEMQGVPDSVVFAVPTDGLGISSSDEDQFGFSYLEFDLSLFKLLENMDGVEFEHSAADVAGFKEIKDKLIVDSVANRIRSTTYKRFNPFNLTHTFEKDRYDLLDKLDHQLRR